MTMMQTPDDGYVNGSVNGIRKLEINIEQNLTKKQVEDMLNQSNWKTPPNQIASYLEILFGMWEVKPDHWLYVAQHYTPKTIKSVRHQMLKAHNRGDITIKSPGAYFTSIIKRKKKRKTFRNTNGGNKLTKETNIW